MKQLSAADGGRPLSLCLPMRHFGSTSYRRLPRQLPCTHTNQVFEWKRFFPSQRHSEEQQYRSKWSSLFPWRCAGKRTVCPLCVFFLHVEKQSGVHNTQALPGRLTDLRSCLVHGLYKTLKVTVWSSKQTLEYFLHFIWPTFWLNHNLVRQLGLCVFCEILRLNTDGCALN